MRNRLSNEIKHFSDLDHIWWGAKTRSGQLRYDNKFVSFKKYCKPKKKFLILEIGCGDGEFTKRLVKLQSRIIATDLTPVVIKRGRKLFMKSKLNNAKFQVEDCEKLSFKKNTFDVVCGVSILHHVNTAKTMSEVHRVLRKGGQFFFTEPNKLNPVIYTALHSSYLRKKMEFSPDETALVRWKVESILKATGFKKFSVKNYDFLHPSIPSFLSPAVILLGNLLENVPIVKEFSGSLVIWGCK